MSTSSRSAKCAGLDLQLPGLDLREVEDVVEGGQQPFGRELHVVGVVALLGVEVGVEQQLGHPDDPVHRRADLVAHVGQELRLQPRGLEGMVACDLEPFLCPLRSMNSPTCAQTRSKTSASAGASSCTSPLENSSAPIAPAAPPIGIATAMCLGWVGPGCGSRSSPGAACLPSRGSAPARRRGRRAPGPRRDDTLGPSREELSRPVGGASHDATCIRRPSSTSHASPSCQPRFVPRTSRTRRSVESISPLEASASVTPEAAALSAPAGPRRHAVLARHSRVRGARRTGGQVPGC